MIRSNRSNVLVVGGDINREPFEQRKLTVKPTAFEALSDSTSLNFASAVILIDFPGKYRLIETYFRDHFAAVCELGLITAILVRDPNDHAQIAQIIEVAYKQHDIDLRA